MRILILCGLMLAGPILASHAAQGDQSLVRQKRLTLAPLRHMNQGEQKAALREWEDGAQPLAWFRREKALHPDAVREFAQSLAKQSDQQAEDGAASPALPQLLGGDPLGALRLPQASRGKRLIHSQSCLGPHPGGRGNLRGASCEPLDLARRLQGYEIHADAAVIDALINIGLTSDDHLEALNDLVTGPCWGDPCLRIIEALGWATYVQAQEIRDFAWVVQDTAVLRDIDIMVALIEEGFIFPPQLKALAQVLRPDMSALSRIALMRAMSRGGLRDVQEIRAFGQNVQQYNRLQDDWLMMALAETGLTSAAHLKAINCILDPAMKVGHCVHVVRCLHRVGIEDPIVIQAFAPARDDQEPFQDAWRLVQRIEASLSMRPPKTDTCIPFHLIPVQRPGAARIAGRQTCRGHLQAWDALLPDQGESPQYVEAMEALDRFGFRACESLMMMRGPFPRLKQG